MGKSLTDVAKSILMNEGVVPSVSSSDNNPDRGGNSSNPNMSTLRPNSRGAEGRFSNPGAMKPSAPDNEVEDLGPALVKQGDVPPSAKAAGKVGKDTSGSSQSRRGTGAGEKTPVKTPGSKTSLAELMEEDVEISEELEAFVESMIEEGYSEDEIAEAIEENFEIVSEGETEVVSEESENYQVDMSEHIEALFSGEDLSEEFKAKATAIFEAAVKAKLEEEIAVIEEAYAETLEEQIESIQEELSSNVDDYLNYVVEQWMGENEIAIEAGLRTELTEDFISGLRNLFAENYIDIPEDKVSVIEEMSERINELETKLNEEIETNVTLSKMLSESTRDDVLLAACDGLTDTQAEKLKALAEGIAFTSVEEYAQKIDILRESYFNSSVSSEHALDRAESNTNGMISEELQGPMAAYVRTLGKTIQK